ncbi:ChrR family anti-sigma-E factor [Woodsholea maritima]|uniref:ChrR family anti-sigma-E factor n=1 Tax=Woodsholea maritima TaxID=240237 RepID=UPI0003A40D70
MHDTHHHISDDLIDAYALGRLPQAYSLVVAAHLSLCDTCRARADALDMIGGALMEASDHEPVNPDLRANVLNALDDPAYKPAPAPKGSGPFPAPVMAALKGAPPKWAPLGMGIRQHILHEDQGGSVRLLYIPPGRAVPHHTHRGLELTLVLQGAFSDSEGHFQRGDVQTARDDLMHQPIADAGEVCICLAATDAPLRFKGWIPSLLQPAFRI